MTEYAISFTILEWLRYRYGDDNVKLMGCAADYISISGNGTRIIIHVHDNVVISPTYYNGRLNDHSRQSILDIASPVLFENIAERIDAIFAEPYKTRDLF